MSSKPASHYFSKRMQQLKQKNEEAKGNRVATDFDQDFKRMEEMTRHMEKAYKRIPDKLEVYLQPDPTKRLSRLLIRNKDDLVREEVVERETLAKVGLAMVEAGTSFGNETSLGSIYIKAGASQVEITKSWLNFQYEASRKYIKPMELFVDDLKDIKKNLNKIQQDRLYLDSTKIKKEKSRRDIMNYDPTVVSHLQKKAETLQENLEIKAGNVQAQMEQFFYELEDDQILLLQSFIAAEIEFHRQALESLTDVVEYMTEVGDHQFISTILPEGTYRPTDKSTRVQKALGLFDFETNEPDCLPFFKGDVLTITNVDTGEEGWWEAMLGGEIGIIPENYVELIEDAGAELKTVIDGGRMVSASGVSSRPTPSAVPERDVEAAAEKKRVEEELEMLKTQQAELLQNQSLALEQQQAQASKQLQTGMFSQALDMALRQLSQSTKGLNESMKQRARPDFKANPAAFDSAVDVLRERAQEVMILTQGLVQKSYGSLPELQLAVTDAIMKLQELALDTKTLSATVVDPADREKLFKSVMSLVDGLKSILVKTGEVAGKGKDIARPAMKGPSKDVVKAIGAVLDVLDAAEARQIQVLLQKKKETEQIAVQQTNDMLDAARKIAKVAQDLAVVAKTAAPTHKQMVGDAQGVTGATAKLVEVATECQKVISMAYADKSDSKYASANGQWSEGLASAAKMVAIAVEDLYKAADDVSKCPAGKVDTKKIDWLRAVANNINAGTMQVVMAGSTKNSDRKLQQKLQKSGADVSAMIEKLVSALNTGYATGASAPNVSTMSEIQRRRAELEAQAKVLQLQRDLDNAQNVLYALRKRRYSRDVLDTPTVPSIDLNDIPPPQPEDDIDEDDIDDDDFDELEIRLKALK
eukprot:CFRG5398T1